MALFRYFTPERGLQVLKTLELVVVPPKFLNDPFEFSPVIKCSDPGGFAQSKVDEITTSPTFFEEHRAHFPNVGTFEQFQKGLRAAPRLLEKLVHDVSKVDLRTEAEAQEIISRRFGVICFSAEGLNTKMWADYASSHSGLVIEFDENHVLFSGHSFLKVEYSNEPFVFDASDRTRRDNVELFATRKTIDWSDERESRLVIELIQIPPPRKTSEGERYFLPIDSALIMSVTLGLRASEDSKTQVVQCLRAPAFKNVELFQIKRNINSRVLERIKLDRVH